MQKTDETNMKKHEAPLGDVNQVMRLLPHRYPMLMVDRITKISQDGDYAVGIKNVTINEPFFAGHFKDNPIMPGVLIIESMAQVAGAYVTYSLELHKKSQVFNVYFLSVDKARFRKPVVPGDVLELHVTMLRNHKNVWKFKGKACVDGAVAAEAHFSAMLTLGKDATL